MCGIIGAVAQRNVVPILLEGLKRLEYRGYDSAGVAVLTVNNETQRVRVKGKVAKLEKALKTKPIKGYAGIAHTRWATHGAPCEENAHPHTSDDNIAIVHNGIIENYESLREALKKVGYEFVTNTDTEAIAHLIHKYFNETKDLLKAVSSAIKKLKGSYAISVIHKENPNRIVSARSGSPLVIGLGIEEYFVASDSLALLPVTQKFIYLEEGDIADISQKGAFIYSADYKRVKRRIQVSTSSADSANRGEYRHYMQKEIFEQPAAINNTLGGRIVHDKILDNIFGANCAEIFQQIENVQIAACGTSYHAGLVARYWIEELADIPCQTEIASEIRYRKTVVKPNALFVTISQSGETADTLSALRRAKELGYKYTLTICNVAESSLVRESDCVFLTRAGAEIGVASTKAFTTQLTALFMLTMALSKQHGKLSKTLETTLVYQLEHLPNLIAKTLTLDNAIDTLAKRFAEKHHALFLGRGTHYPIAMEGALKLKEISYIHAESYPAGELKHGPLALIDNDIPIIVVAPNNELLEKLKSNINEVKARGGQLIVFADNSINMKNTEGLSIIKMPKVNNFIAPIVYTIPLQLLAYHIAVLKGTDVDQPRNLAKSVTVE